MLPFLGKTSLLQLIFLVNFKIQGRYIIKFLLPVSLIASDIKNAGPQESVGIILKDVFINFRVMLSTVSYVNDFNIGVDFEYMFYLSLFIMQVLCIQAVGV